MYSMYTHLWKSWTTPWTFRRLPILLLPSLNCWNCRPSIWRSSSAIWRPTRTSSWKGQVSKWSRPLECTESKASLTKFPRRWSTRRLSQLDPNAIKSDALPFYIWKHWKEKEMMSHVNSTACRKTRCYKSFHTELWVGRGSNVSGQGLH